MINIAKEMTDYRLAECLDEFNKWRRGIEPFNNRMPISNEFLGEIFDEVVCRLKTEKHYPDNYNYD